MTRRSEVVVLSLALLLSGVSCFGGGGRPGVLDPVLASSDVTASQADSSWLRAVQLYRTGKWAKAATAFQVAQIQLPSTDPRLVEASFFLAEIQLARRENLLAVRAFRRLADETPGHTLAPQALLRAGDAYAGLWRRPELDPTYGATAMSIYREVTERYPGTDAARIASMRIADLNEKFAFKEFKTALFYLRFKAWDSALLALRNLVSEYPRTSIAPQALIKMVETYDRLGYEEDLRETCDYLLRQHAGAPGVGGACSVPPRLVTP